MGLGAAVVVAHPPQPRERIVGGEAASDQPAATDDAGSPEPAEAVDDDLGPCTDAGVQGVEKAVHVPWVGGTPWSGMGG